MNLVRKLSMKGMGINPKGLIKGKEDGFKTPVFRIAGTAGSLKRGESNFGPWVAFMGSFVAVDLTNPAKPEAYQSGSAFLPKVIEDMLVKAVEIVDPESGEVSNRDVQFDITVGLVVNEKSTVGYEYTVTPNMKIASNAEALLTKMGYDPAKLLVMEKTEEKKEDKTKGGKGKK